MTPAEITAMLAAATDAETREWLLTTVRGWNDLSRETCPHSGGPENCPTCQRQNTVPTIIAGLLAEVEGLRKALRDVDAVMGPKAAPCCDGCAWEWNEALGIVYAAIGPSRYTKKETEHAR